MVRVAYCVLIVFVFVVCAVAAAQSTATHDDVFVPPDDLLQGWYARIETSLGRILVKLHPEQAPQAVAHFAGLAEGTLEWLDSATGEPPKSPYYDGIQIHFAKAGYLFEAGYRHGNTRAPPLFVPHEGQSKSGFSHRGGRLGMKTIGAGISGVVFFVTASPMRGFDGKYPCFGSVVSDLETVFRITEVTTYDNGRPIEPVTIEKIRIFSVGDPPPLPEPLPYTPQPVPLEADPQR